MIGLGRKDLYEYCHMRIFNTLFDQEELDDGVREIIWPKLLHVEEY